MDNGILYGHHFEHHKAKIEHKVRERRRLLIGIVLTGSMMVFELIGGILTNSLALLSDAGHMFTHFFALGMSFSAIILASRPSSKSKTFGYFRTEVLSALFNGFFIILISAYIFWESIGRWISPKPIASLEMLFVANVGLVINLITALVLHDVSKEDLNVKSAFLHMLGDTLSSIGVIIAAIVIFLTNIPQVDTIASFAIALVILIWGIKLTNDSVHILLQSTPKEIDIDELVRKIKKDIKEIQGIHDVHIWELTSNDYYFSAHVTLQDCRISECNEVLDRINRHLDSNYNIKHTTIQIECSHMFHS